MPEKKLVIIESPAKARSLRNYLGKDFEVVASVGHVRDLPRNRIGVSEENGFQPTYTVLPEQRQTVASLKKKATSFSRIYLAADPDREGEAICWHLSRLLEGEGRTFRRLRFNAVTRSAVTEAMKNPSKIDMDLVEAQQARRVMDRLVGYRVSPYLWKTLGKGLSAGRVQTVALRLVQEREDRIGSFVPREYWVVTAEFGADGGSWTARLSKMDGRKADDEESSPATAVEVEELEPRVRDAEWELAVVDRQSRPRKPGPPFITSTLQAAASQQLSMAPGRTMKCAQELYEGIDAGGDEPAGLITYMRTDSVRMSPSAIQECSDYIVSRWGRELLVDKPRRYRSSGGSQDAHEAIRPVDPSRTPESLKQHLTRDQHRLYELIWKRFLATQMRDAVVEKTTLVFRGDGLEFTCTGEKLTDPGFTEVDPSQLRTEKELGGDPVKGPVKCTRVSSEQRFTSPPPRFTEAALVSEMKKKGIGRPSTYVSIISTLKKRKYVESRERKLYPTELGTQAVRLLVDLFPHIFETGFTARMETLLDSVARGLTGYVEALSELNRPLSSSLELAMKRLPEVRKNLEEGTGRECPKCGREMVVKWGQYGRFMACSGFPDCRHTEPMESQDGGRFEDRKCPECGAPLVLRNGRYGAYLACSNAPRCRHSECIPTGVPCPVEGCGGELVERRTRKGRQFFSCNRYPACDYALWNRPLDRECPRCGFPILERRRKGTYCPRCRKKIED
jgi:DNA topoisomerase-1